MAKKPSTALSQEHEVGVKWKIQRGVAGDPWRGRGGDVVAKRRLRRAQVITYFAALLTCLVGMEACATAHFWARELRSLGHEVRLMPP